MNQRGSAEDVQSEISMRVSEHEGNTTVQSKGLHMEKGWKEDSPGEAVVRLNELGCPQIMYK